jgi:hypothetical protein
MVTAAVGGPAVIAGSTLRVTCASALTALVAAARARRSA